MISHHATFCAIKFSVKGKTAQVQRILVKAKIAMKTLMKLHKFYNVITTTSMKVKPIFSHNESLYNHFKPKIMIILK